MTEAEYNELAPKQLERILSFFSRLESKASFLFGINAALIGSLALNVRELDLYRWPNVATAAMATAMIAASFYFVFATFFPNLRGGQSSLIYFREIAKLAEKEYIARFKALTPEEYANDLLAQTWRNSEILSAKFRAVKVAFFLTAFALAPWAVFLILASVTHAALPVLK